MTISMKDAVFSSKKPDDKASRTDTVARAIIMAEASARQSKTERLRAARLKMEAECAEPEPAKKPRATPKTPKFIKA